MSTPHKCPVCDGRGVVKTSVNATGTGRDEGCPACSGTCIVWESDREPSLPVKPVGIYTWPYPYPPIWQGPYFTIQGDSTACRQQ